jgi:hypothetical protein
MDLSTGLGPYKIVNIGHIVVGWNHHLICDPNAFQLFIKLLHEVLAFKHHG